jgi:hypothetical protein
LITNCKENISAVKTELINLFKELTSKKHEYFTDENIEIVPYNETLIERNKNSRYNTDNIGNCYFEKVYRLGDFVVKKSGMRAYCYFSSVGI